MLHAIYGGAQTHHWVQNAQYVAVHRLHRCLNNRSPNSLYTSIHHTHTHPIHLRPIHPQHKTLALKKKVRGNVLVPRRKLSVSSGGIVQLQLRKPKIFAVVVVILLALPNLMKLLVRPGGIVQLQLRKPLSIVANLMKRFSQQVPALKHNLTLTFVDGKSFCIW